MNPPSVPDGLAVVHELTDAQSEQLLGLYRAEWWTSERTIGDVREMLGASGLVVGVVDATSRELVAFTRAITDRVYHAMVLDVIVRADLRGRGLGDVVLGATLGDPAIRRVRKVVLQCREGKVAFYARWGFEVTLRTPEVAGQGTGAWMQLRRAR